MIAVWLGSIFLFHFLRSRPTVCIVVGEKGFSVSIGEGVCCGL